MAAKKEINQSLPLHRAVEIGNICKIKIFMKRTNPNSQDDENGSTALHIACNQDKNEEILDLLLSAKDIDVTLKNNKGFTALHFLAFRGNLTGIYELLEKFPQVNIDEEDNNKNTPLISATKMNRVTLVKYLATKGANVKHANNKGYTALHYAANNGYHRCAEVLLSLGADVNAKDAYHLTPLIKACKWGFYETCEILVKNGADVNYSTPGSFLNTALASACYNDSDKVVRILLNRKADVHFPGSYSIALFQCAKRGSLECAKLLIDAGVSTTATTKQGESAVDLAKQKGNDEIIKLIQGLK